jgi:hypothetical protein
MLWTLEYKLVKPSAKPERLFSTYDTLKSVEHAQWALGGSIKWKIVKLQK